MTVNSNVVKNTTNVNSLILKSKNDFTDLLLRFLNTHPKKTFQLKSSIYEGNFDNKAYPFVHQHLSFLLLKLLNNLVLKCPFYKNKFQFVKSLYDFKPSYKKLSGVYTIKGDSLPKGFDLACVVSTVPKEQKKNGYESKYTLQSHAMMKKMSEHFNIIILKTKLPHLCLSFCSIVCGTGLQMKTFQIQNTRLSQQVLQWKNLVKTGKLSKSLCYTITEVPSLTLHKYLQKSTFENTEWKSILFQICFTMVMLQKEIPGFIHHNLTPKCIHLQKVPKGGQFVYVVGKTKYYVPNIGYVVKILPSSYSYAQKLYENVIVHDESFQASMGVHPQNTSFYDLHLLCNTLYHTKNTSSFMKNILKSLIPSRYLGKNSSELINSRLRIHTKRPQKCTTFSKLLKSKTFSSFKTINKNNIVFYPSYKV